MGRSLRILHITKRFWPLPGGVERYVLDLGAEQVRLDHRVRVLTIDHDILSRRSHRLAPVENHAGIEIHRVRAFGGARKQFLAELPGTVVRLLGWADVIHHHEPRFLLETAVLAHMASRTPLVFHSHGMILHTPQFRRLKEIALRVYYGPLLKHGVDVVIAGGESDARLLETYCGLAEGPRMRLYQEGIDLRRSQTIARTPDSGRVLCFGRIDLHKGHRRLLETLAHVSADWTLDIAGGGPPDLVESLRQHAFDLGVAGRVQFLGRVTDQELDELLAHAAVVAFPSEYEGFGLALVEALAAGALVVASDISSHREVLGPNLADRLADFTNSDAAGRLGFAMSMGLDETKVAERKARDRARQFSVDRLAADIEGLYSELGVY